MTKLEKIAIEIILEQIRDAEDDLINIYKGYELYKIMEGDIGSWSCAIGNIQNAIKWLSKACDYDED